MGIVSRLRTTNIMQIMMSTVAVSWEDGLPVSLAGVVLKHLRGRL